MMQQQFTPWSKALLVAAAALVAACAPGAEAPTAASAARSESPVKSVDTLRIGSFSRTPVVALGKAHGFFAAESLTIVDSLTANSPMIFRKLRDGQWDIILTQIDNVFNYRFNASNPHGSTFEPVAILGADWGNGASLMARPGFTPDSVRGKNVIVDSPNSGFAFVLYGILRKHGLERGVDYTVVTTGGTPGRYADLVRGFTVKGTDTIAVAATILNAGYDYRAADAGMSRLGVIADAASPFMGGSGVALRSWLDANPAIAVRFIRAYVRAQQYVLDPANREEVLAWLRADANGSESVAQGTYKVLTTIGDGLIPNGKIDREGLYGTAALRDAFGGFDTPQDLSWLASPESGVYDLRYWYLADRTLQGN